MSLLGQAAMLLSFDVVTEAVPEHDDWHTHEHLPERLSIPGFKRGTRWVAVQGPPRYFVVYEVESLDTLASGPYLERLNHPSPWTSRMMLHYRGMTRGFCALSGSFGHGTGNAAVLLRFKPAAGSESTLRQWLLGAALPSLPQKPGIGGLHLFEGALTPAMTKEQSIRGKDAGFDWALLVTGYDEGALAALLAEELSRSRFEAQGATAITDAAYRLHYSLTHHEVQD